MSFPYTPTPLHPYTPTPLHPYTPTPLHPFRVRRQKAQLNEDADQFAGAISLVPKCSQNQSY